MRYAFLALILISCADETSSGDADPDAVYSLTEIDGNPFGSRATITFPEAGRVAGEAPCNRWSAAQTAPDPWIAVGPIAATRRACADLEAEAAFFDALQDVTIAEVRDEVLILSNESGRSMVFQSR